MKGASLIAVGREIVAGLLTRSVVAMTSPAVTAAWIRLLVWARHLARMDRRPLVDNTRRVLVVRPDGLGDVVLTGPFLRELRRGDPDAHITLVVRPDVLNLVETCPFIDRVLTLRLTPATRWWHPLSRRLTTLLFARRHLWNEAYELAISPRWGVDRYEASTLISLSGAVRRTGHSQRSSVPKGTHTMDYDRFFTDVVDDRSVKHEVQRNLDLLSALGMNPFDDTLEVWLSDQDGSLRTRSWRPPPQGLLSRSPWGPEAPRGHGRSRDSWRWAGGSWTEDRDW